MPRSRQAKPCDLCHTPALVRYRIQCSPAAAWVLACRVCQTAHRQHNPHYRYGGTWKASRKQG